MEFTVKKFQSMRTLDGGGFSYDLYIDGVRAAFVCDEGHGGELMVQWCDRKQGVSELQQKFEAHIKTLPPEPIAKDAEAWEKEMYPTGFREVDGDLFLYALADTFENAKRLKRLCKNKTLFCLPTDDPKYLRTLKVAFTPEVKVRLLQKYPNAVIINEEVAQ